MAEKTVKAVWEGGMHELVDGTPLIHGETVVEVPKSIADVDPKWRALSPAKAKAATEVVEPPAPPPAPDTSGGEKS